MVTQSETYPDKAAARAAKARGGTRHQNGFTSIHTNFNTDGTVTIVWSNDPPPPPTAEEIEIASLRQDLQNEVIGLPQLIRYLKLIEI